MGAIKGNMTIRRYQVRGKPDDRQRVMRGIRAHQLIPIDPMSDVEVSVGWARLDDPTKVDFSTTDVFIGQTVSLSLRIDTLKPPAPLVKRQVAEKLMSLDHRPTKGEKKAAKEEVIRKLRSRYFPTIRAIDMVWFLDEEKVYFWSHSKKVNGYFLDLFTKSFKFDLVPMSPGLLSGIRTPLEPTVEMLGGFPGLPGRSTAWEDDDKDEDDHGDDMEDSDE